MGTDKALLPHPEGGTWLARGLELLRALGRPVTLLSGHASHLAMARAIVEEPTVQGEPWLTVIGEPPPWEGPLRALARLMDRHPDERLLLCPVDMPWLDAMSLQTLVAAAGAEGDATAASPAEEAIRLAHDGDRLQPLLGLYPATGARRARLAAHLATGDRGLQRWLAGEDWRPVPLPPGPLRNVNRPEEIGLRVDPSAAPGP